MIDGHTGKPLHESRENHLHGSSRKRSVKGELAFFLRLLIKLINRFRSPEHWRRKQRGEPRPKQERKKQFPARSKSMKHYVESCDFSSDLYLFEPTPSNKYDEGDVRNFTSEIANASFLPISYRWGLLMIFTFVTSIHGVISCEKLRTITEFWGGQIFVFIKPLILYSADGKKIRHGWFRPTTACG